MKYEPRDYQQRAIDALWDYFERSDGNPLVVLPTGSGKSYVLAAFIERCMQVAPDATYLVCSHVGEIVSQDAKALDTLLPWGSVGVYSASLNRKELGCKVTVASIQSIVNARHEMPVPDLLFVDEAHLVPVKGNGRYRTLIATLREKNPRLKVIGLTATAFRMKSGLLTEGEGAIFTDVAIEIGIKELIEKGWLSPLRSKCGATEADLSEVKISAGDYVASQAESAMMDAAIIEGALDECEAYAADRKSWIVFCAGIDHALKVVASLNDRGIPAAAVFGSTPKDMRKAIIKSFREGYLRAIVNVQVLTIGFDAPATDLVVLMRPTKSAGLYVQMIGRGMRIAPGKKDALVLDFANNIREHGPVDEVTVSAASGNKRAALMGPFQAPCKICPSCREFVPASLRVCTGCSYIFPKEEAPPHSTEASELEIISTKKKRKWLRVSQIRAFKHMKPDKPPSIKVTYTCGISAHREWVCLEHGGYATTKACEWWRKWTGNKPPMSTDEALLRFADEMPDPSQVELEIAVMKDGKHMRVVDHRIGEAQ